MPQAEAVVAEGRKSATAIVSGNKLVAPDIGLAVLRRLSLLSSPEAAQKLQVCKPLRCGVGGMHTTDGPPFCRLEYMLYSKTCIENLSHANVQNND